MPSPSPLPSLLFTLTLTLTLTLLFSSCSASEVEVGGLKFEEKWFTQKLDHFNFQVKDTYEERYFVNDQFWGSNPVYSSSSCKGPIFFYTGNESPVTSYIEASGFFNEVIAPKFGGILIYAEHRYFGESVPFNTSNPWSPEHVGWCTPDQALADYAELIKTLKLAPDMADCPVFAFGGSYGGMLTTWFRIKYPNIVDFGLAASAPFAFEGSGVSPYAFALACTDTYNEARAGCGDSIKKGLSDLNTMATTAEGRQTIASYFSLCDQSLPTQEAAEEVIEWAVNGLIDQAMLDYPYPTDYGIAIPGWPVNKTCDIVQDFTGPRAHAVALGMNPFYNGTGTHLCFDVNKDVPNFGVCCGWPYLACTEVFIPSGLTGMFPFAKYSADDSIKACAEQFEVELDPSWSQTHWGGFDALQATSKLIFSNGLLDPWHTSGVTQSISKDLPAILIPEAAHHLDLRGPNPADPEYVKAARAEEMVYISKWLTEYFSVSRVEL